MYFTSVALITMVAVYLDFMMNPNDNPQHSKLTPKCPVLKVLPLLPPDQDYVLQKKILFRKVVNFPVGGIFCCIIICANFLLACKTFCRYL
jgi:hypothetical protein